jgi:hypothetical protein
MRRLLLILVVLFALPAVSYAQPSITFESENHDFGTVGKGEALEHSFIVTNAGDKELIIEKLIPS